MYGLGSWSGVNFDVMIKVRVKRCCRRVGVKEEGMI